MTDAKSKDLELWLKWKKSRSSMDLEALMTQVMPLLRRETSRWSRIAPTFVLDAEAKKLALKAFETYDPNRVPITALASHITNHLQKLSRFAYARQSSVGIPEHQRLTFNKYNNVKRKLEDQLGYAPTIDDIADHMGIPPHKLAPILQNVGRKEFLESGEGPAFQQQGNDDDIIHLAVADMTAQQRSIFEMRTGYNKKPIVPASKIMKELKITQGQLSYELIKIKEVLKRAQKLR